MSSEVQVGQIWEWMGHSVAICRVAKNGSWADIFVYQDGGTVWSKRQPLPMKGAVLVGSYAC